MPYQARGYRRIGGAPRVQARGIVTIPPNAWAFAAPDIRILAVVKPAIWVRIPEIGPARSTCP
ncbi:MAG: hypothetical protein AAF771_15285 [Pseudomonadota bacterium]